MNNYRVTIKFQNGNRAIFTEWAASAEAAMMQAFNVFAPGALTNIRSVEMEKV